jgi:hypothetical protein
VGGGVDREMGGKKAKPLCLKVYLSFSVQKRKGSSDKFLWLRLYDNLFVDAEMVESMKKVASMDVELTVEERNLLSVAYKNVIGARRASWRIISSIEQKEENKGAEDKLELIRNYRNQVWIMYSNFIH